MGLIPRQCMHWKTKKWMQCSYRHQKSQQSRWSNHFPGNAWTQIHSMQCESLCVKVCCQFPWLLIMLRTCFSFCWLASLCKAFTSHSSGFGLVNTLDLLKFVWYSPALCDYYNPTVTHLVDFAWIYSSLLAFLGLLYNNIYF